MARILIVDDEEDVRASLARRLQREGHEVVTAASQEEGIRLIQDSTPSFDVVLTDMLMESPTSGVEILKAALMRDLFTEVIVLTAYGNVSNAVECMKLGAFDYVEKNIPGVDVYDLICMKLDHALEHRRTSIGTVRKLEQVGRFRETV
jgi:DNA-binding NtrC family response regulator